MKSIENMTDSELLEELKKKYSNGNVAAIAFFVQYNRMKGIEKVAMTAIKQFTKEFGPVFYIKL